MEGKMTGIMNWNYKTLKLRAGEILGLKRLEYDPKAFLATKEADIKGEFGLSVVLAVIFISSMARMGFDWSFGSILIWLLALLFCEMARARQEFFRRWLVPNKLLKIDRYRL
jgi:hypothetical protein